LPPPSTLSSFIPSHNTCSCYTKYWSSSSTITLFTPSLKTKPCHHPHHPLITHAITTQHERRHQHHRPALRILTHPLDPHVSPPFENKVQTVLTTTLKNHINSKAM
jgi:hypothetical protein